MPQPGNIGTVAPSSDAWIAQKFRDLEQQIAEVRTAQTGNAMSISGQPGVTITNGGSLRIYAADGHLVAVVGLDDTGEHNGIIAYRPDGSESLHVDQSGFAGIFEKGGRVVLSDDFMNGGLATPHIPLGLPVDTDVTKWPGTTSTDWTSIAECKIERQNPFLSWNLGIASIGDCTTEFQITINDTVIGDPVTMTPNTAGEWLSNHNVYPDDATIGTDQNHLQIQAHVVSGTGTAAAVIRQLRGQQS